MAAVFCHDPLQEKSIVSSVYNKLPCSGKRWIFPELSFASKKYGVHLAGSGMDVVPYIPFLAFPRVRAKSVHWPSRDSLTLETSVVLEKYCVLK